MKPLVLWCRWHDATLRLRGRDDSAVWGELAFPGDKKPFHFDLEGWQLTIGKGPDRRQLQLDEMGVEIGETS
ncbi:MAG TPA: hypothetical protein VE553_08930 [Candidatus Binatia bacterium]|jgi:hypothetical protein|nr:hypothetical protein [Candidatus Binatia bacterium]